MELPEFLLVTGRVLLGGLFVAGSLRHVFVFPMILQKMKARGVVAAPFLLVAGSLFQTVAGACLMAGILMFPAALGLAAFTVAASLMLLDFWNKVGPEREATINAALCNVAVIGGLFIAAAISPI
jgi:putative oxidoreductase